MSNIIKPKALKPGDLIGVFSPSSYVDKTRIGEAKEFIENKGFGVFLHPQYEKKFNQSAGTAPEKAQAFHDLLQNPDITAIIASGGGNRALHVLPLIDFDLVRQHPKIIMGFSDVTAILSAAHARTGLVTFHGPILGRIDKVAGFEATMDLLQGGCPKLPMTQARVLRPGQASGPLIGGNLSLFHYLAGTPDAPAANGHILFLEDLREEINKIDRMLLHLKRTGFLDNVSGIICGAFSNLGDNGRPYGFTLEDLLLEHTDGLDIPIVLDAPFGHLDQLYTLPIGVSASLKASDTGIELTLNEAAVQL